MESTIRRGTPGVRRALVVVHERPVGPVARVAAAVAAALRAEGVTVRVVRPDDLVDWADLDLLVIGASATALATRRDRGTGLGHWLAALPQGGDAGPALATYETRLSRRGLRRGAAVRTTLGLSSRGWRVASVPATFFVGASGALGVAEVARASRWGYDLARGAQRHGPLDDGPALLAGADLTGPAELVGALS